MVLLQLHPLLLYIFIITKMAFMILFKNFGCFLLIIIFLQLKVLSQLPACKDSFHKHYWLIIPFNNLLFALPIMAFLWKEACLIILPILGVLL